MKMRDQKRNQLWMPPTKLRLIPPKWWDVLLDGTLWVLNLSEDIPFPVKSHEVMRQACYRQARLRELRVSIRLDTSLTLMYVQAYSRQNSAYDARQPLETALKAPGMPMILRDPQALSLNAPPARFPELMAELVAEQEAAGLPDYPAAAFLEHPVIGYFADQCDCDAASFRSHSDGCPATSLMKMLAADVRGLELAPETWAQYREQTYGRAYWARNPL